jgi:hypothetical protein
MIGCNKLKCPIQPSRILDLLYEYSLGWNKTRIKTSTKETQMCKIVNLFILLVSLFSVPKIRNITFIMFSFILRFYATSRKVSSSIPDVIEPFFKLPSPSIPTMA